MTAVLDAPMGATQTGTCATVVPVVGELDIATAPALMRRVDVELSAGATHIQLDMSRVSFMDAIAIGALILIVRDAAERGRHVRLTHPSRQVSRVLDLAGVSLLA